MTSLENTEYLEQINYYSNINGNKSLGNHKRMLTSYDPPFNNRVSTNKGRIYLNLFDKHFRNENN